MGYGIHTFHLLATFAKAPLPLAGEGPAAQRWEGEGTRGLTAPSMYCIDIIIFLETAPDGAQDSRDFSVPRATLTLPTLRAGSLPLPQAVEGLILLN